MKRLAAGGWLIMFGLWPLVDPDHAMLSEGVYMLDIATHGAGCALVASCFVGRWHM